MDKYDGKEFYDGAVSLVNLSNGEETLSGTGILITENNKVYATFKTPDTPITLDCAHAILFKGRDRQDAKLSLVCHIGDMFSPFGDATGVYDMQDFLYCKSATGIQEFISDGLDRISIYVKGRGGEEVTIRPGYSSAETRVRGEKTRLGTQNFEDMTITLESNYSACLGREHAIECRLGIIVEFEKPLPMILYSNIVKSIELYWRLYLEKTELNIDRISIARSSKDKKAINTGDINLKEPIGASSSERPLVIKQADVSLENLHNILAIFTEGIKNNKLAYGFLRYLELSSRGAHLEDMVLHTAAALDSVCSYVAGANDKQQDVNKKKIKEEIGHVQQVIREELKRKISPAVYEFYCNSDIDSVYGALSRRSFERNVSVAVKVLGLDYTQDQQEAVKILNKARNQIIHGQGYNIEAMLQDLYGRGSVTKDKKTGSYTYSCQDGAISQVSRLLLDIGRKYFGAKT